MNGCPADAYRLRLRTATKADFPELAALWVASWQEAMPGIDFEARRPWLAQHLSALHKAGSFTICAVAERGGLIGFATFNPATSYLDQLAVAPAAKGRGAARLLLNEVRRFSKGRIELDVNADNSRAIAFYTREGFVTIGAGSNPRSGLKTLRLRWDESG